MISKNENWPKEETKKCASGQSCSALHDNKNKMKKCQRIKKLKSKKYPKTLLNCSKNYMKSLKNVMLTRNV